MEVSGMRAPPGIKIPPERAVLSLQFQVGEGGTVADRMSLGQERGETSADVGARAQHGHGVAVPQAAHQGCGGFQRCE